MSDPSLPRRGFLGRLSAAAAVLTAGAVTPQLASAARPSVEPADDVHALDKWMADLPGRYKQVFDIVTAENVSWMAYASNFLRASVTDYGLTDADHAVIVVLRHSSTPWGYNDAMWDKYAIGEKLNITEPRSEAKARRNPMLRNADGRDALIAQLAGRGVHFAMCGLSTTRYAQEWARGTTMTAADVRADLVANLVPNGHVAAAGVVAVNRAQHLGFTYLHVG